MEMKRDENKKEIEEEVKKKKNFESLPHSVPLQCKDCLKFQLSQKLIIIAQNGGQGPDKHETRKKNTFGGSGGPQGIPRGQL